jgi:hypothetical protein
MITVMDMRGEIAAVLAQVKYENLPVLHGVDRIMALYSYTVNEDPTFVLPWNGRA